MNIHNLSGAHIMQQWNDWEMPKPSNNELLHFKWCTYNAMMEWVGCNN